MSKYFNPFPGGREITTIEAHTAGEPLRVFVDGFPEIPGDTILEKRKYARRHHDDLRKALMWEPRGHADMYGAIITDPVTADGDLGVLFMHNEGFSTMCGHGIIALTKVVFDMGLRNAESDRPVLKIDSPAGRITAIAHISSGIVKSVSFINVPSYLHEDNLTVEVPGLGEVKYAIAFGGAYYAYVDSEPLGLKLNAEGYNELIDVGMKIKNAVMDSYKINHPFEEDMGYLYGTIFMGPAIDPEHHSRNICIFAEGEVDRSPTGTGISGRAAIHFARSELEPGQKISIESILGTCMTVEVTKTTSYGPHSAIIPRVSGCANITGSNTFWFDPEDSLRKGFVLR